MTESARPRRWSDESAGFVRKLIVTVVTGGIAYFVTVFTSNNIIQSITLSSFLGGVVLVVQFLADFDSRMASIERQQAEHELVMRQLVREGFSKISEATKLFGLVEDSPVRADTVTQLVRNATLISSDQPIIYAFVQLEIGRTSLLLQQLSGGVEVSCEGEDRDWLLGLTTAAEHSIQATSYSTVDAGDTSFNDGFWSSDLGQRYLLAQRDAVRRGVSIRRVFIFDRAELANQPEFLAICQVQVEIGIDVRIIHHSDLRHPTLVLRDFILFDGVISYETVASPSRALGETRSSILNTHLVLDHDRLKGRRTDFDELWHTARPFERAVPP